jgi:acetylornithine deacetylase/succinyl-diaminopimelate desuccinylase-like protein
LPDENPDAFLDEVKKVVNDPAIEVKYAARDVREGGPSARLDSEAFKVIEAAVTRHYGVVTLPTMSTGATDMAYLRAKGIHSFGIGPALDIEDGPKGFGAHSDQERILESELHRFVVLNGTSSWNCRVRSSRTRKGEWPVKEDPQVSETDVAVDSL